MGPILHHDDVIAGLERVSTCHHIVVVCGARRHQFSFHDTGASHDSAIVSVFLHRSDLCTSKPTVVERLHGMSRSGVLTQRITTVMHSGTHIDAPAHVVQGYALHGRSPAALLLRHRATQPAAGLLKRIAAGKTGIAGGGGYYSQWDDESIAALRARLAGHLRKSFAVAGE
jgi:hypothetical protein